MLIAVLAWFFTALLLMLAVTCIVAGRGGLACNRFFGVKLRARDRSDLARPAYAAGTNAFRRAAGMR